MIPRAYVTEWRDRAPWPSDEQVEQDLIITRVLIELFRRPVIQDALAFRGGGGPYSPGLVFFELIAPAAPLDCG